MDFGIAAGSERPAAGCTNVETRLYFSQTFGNAMRCGWSRGRDTAAVH